MGNSLIRKGVTFASPVYKQRKQGRSPTFATCSIFLRKLRRSPPLPKPKESSDPPLVAAVALNTSALLRRFCHGSEDRQDREVGRGVAA